MKNFILTGLLCAVMTNTAMGSETITISPESDFVRVPVRPYESNIFITVRRDGTTTHNPNDFPASPSRSSPARKSPSWVILPESNDWVLSQ